VNGLVVDGLGVGFAAFGLLNPLLAAFIHVASELTFILNSTRLLPRTQGVAVGPAAPLQDRRASTVGSLHRARGGRRIGFGPSEACESQGACRRRSGGAMWDAAASTSPGGNVQTDARRVDRRGIPWTVAGVVFLVLVVFLIWQFGRETNPTRELAFKASRVDIVGRMELALASAAEAEKSAVLAITDQDSQTFADQARAATAEVERERQELGKLLATGGTKGEQDLLSRFSEAFGDLRRIDEEVLRLAARLPIP